MATSTATHPTTYVSRDDPARLTALLRAAIIGKGPVVLTWMDGTEQRVEYGQPTALDPVEGHARIRTPEGESVKVRLWDVMACEMAGAEGWEAA